ncbi:GNAT family N-acetyltransferase [Streptomyces sp. NPDC001380]|uniref:GNAT family N-acetyltransferase n=1 Tax=Streptomyces sp. NPDC001380 TaxID=3364566 RepID=UPI0036916A99
MRIREVRAADHGRLQEIERASGQCFREVGLPEIADDEPFTDAELDRYRRAGLAWAAVDGADVPVAYLLAEPVDDALHVEQVSVHPDHAHHRIGRALLDHAAGHAAARGMPALTLTTFAEVPWNAPYYGRCGFRTMDEEQPGPELRALVRREADLGLDLRPRVCMRRPV